MSSKNIQLVISSIAIILSVIAIVLVLNVNHFNFSNNTNKSDNKENNNTVETSIPTNTPVVTKEPEETSTPISTPVVTSEPVKTSTPTIEVKSEDNVINYVNSLSDSLFTNTNENDSSVRDKVKKGFVTIVDFIFYDGEIKGYKFKELTNSAKLKIISVALKVDSKIDQYFPNYKDKIKDKYIGLKGKLALLYLEYTAKLCDSVGEESCNQAKSDFNDMKESFGFAWDLIVELSKSGSEKLSEFYLKWRDE